MDEIKKKHICGQKIFAVMCGAALTVAGFIVIPPLIDKYANKVYKASLNKEDINFDDMEPQIVPEEGTEE